MSLFGDLTSPGGIDAAVRAQLASSLAHIFDRANGRLEVDASRFQAALDRIRAIKQDPGVFARYYDLIFAIGANQLPEARSLLGELIESTERPVRFEIVAYTPEEFGADYERFPRLMFSEFSRVNPMASPSVAQAAASKQAVEEALEIVAQVDPGIRAEIEELLVRIVLATANKDPSAKPFGGVTSFLVWGASFANIESYKTRWDMVQFLVHEITHGLLFGLALNEPLVKNPPEESYKSPLRADPRPMDGIYHATLVCGRLAEFHKSWLESGLLDGADRARSEKAIPTNLHRFRDGIAVINEHGKLSDRGRQLLERACDELLVVS